MATKGASPDAKCAAGGVARGTKGGMAHSIGVVISISCSEVSVPSCFRARAAAAGIPASAGGSGDSGGSSVSSLRHAPLATTPQMTSAKNDARSGSSAYRASSSHI